MSWLQKLKHGLSKSRKKVSDSLKSLSSLSSLIGSSKLDASSLEEVEDALIGADLGTASAARLAEAMRKHKFDGPVTANSLAVPLIKKRRNNEAKESKTKIVNRKQKQRTRNKTNESQIFATKKNTCKMKLAWNEFVRQDE